jgi:uncharacterized protein YaaW (UPF0174 family)
MSPEVILSFIRQALMFAGGFAVTQGYLDSNTLVGVVGAVVTLVSSGWSIYNAKLVAAAKK